MKLTSFSSKKVIGLIGFPGASVSRVLLNFLSRALLSNNNITDIRSVTLCDDRVYVDLLLGDAT